MHRVQFSFKHLVASTSSRSIESTTSLSVVHDNGMKSSDLLVQDVTEHEHAFKTINELIIRKNVSMILVFPFTVLMF